MINVAFYPTGHGYGHFTRLMAVAGVFKTYPDVNIHVRAPFSREKVLDALGFLPDSFKNVRFDLGLAQIDSLHNDLPETINRLEYYYGSEGEKNVAREAEELKKLSVDAAVIDIPPRAFDICKLAGIPAFATSNFSWDDIWRSYVEEEPRFETFSNLAVDSYRNTEVLLRTKMNFGMNVFSNVIDVPLIARKSTREVDEILSALGLSHDKPVVLIGYGGEGLKGIKKPDKKLLDRFSFIASEPMADPGEGFYYFPEKLIADKGLRYFDLVKAADIAMIKPGYSMVAECVANQTAVLYTPREHFIEAEHVVAYMEENLPTEILPYDDLIDGLWENALVRLEEKMPFLFKPVETNGAEVIAKLVLGSLGR